MSVSSRSALEVMRLVELLLVLVMEGRKALPKTCPHSAIAAKRELELSPPHRTVQQMTCQS